ncbi:aldo/keto reductase [Salinibacterium sp. SYSU T00001]|uniref:aldo/keto reductase n=1 Tax=Homoserinimonas sedimenticola TaxID=2986805 RepID=UPI0022364D5C|nr:aldo/keto reductase [Salinibacterium sedimenticola]MCW4384962.1 aldo/keto reductase [Salinibacterium sedimenticola]
MSQQSTEAALRLDPVGYGAMSLGGAYGPIDEASAQHLLAAVLDAGVSHIDTANIYGDGSSEEIIGRFLRGRDREQVFLASKTGLSMGAGVGSRTISGRRETILANIDDSLRRLGTDHLDLYYQHRVDPEVPIEDTVGAFAELVQAGKVRHIGLSEATGEELRRAHAVHPIAAVQSEWSIVSRDIEVHVVPTAVELGIAVVPYSSVSRGLLTDSFDADAAAHDMRKAFPRFHPENLPANIALAREVRSVARRLGRATEEVAIAWLLAKGRSFGATVSVIPGTRSPEHLASNLRAATLELGPDDLATLDSISARVRGARSGSPQWVSGGREGLL